MLCRPAVPRWPTRTACARGDGRCSCSVSSPAPPVHTLWRGIDARARGLGGPGRPRNAPALSGLAAALCAQPGEHVAARLQRETRTRHITETGISCHRKSLTYLCHFNALHSEPGFKKNTKQQYTPPWLFRENLSLLLKGLFMI